MYKSEHNKYIAMIFYDNYIIIWWDFNHMQMRIYKNNYLLQYLDAYKSNALPFANLIQISKSFAWSICPELYFDVYVI